MKKLIIAMLTILSCGAAYALPIGNPSDASLLCDGLFLEGNSGDPSDPCLSWCDAFSIRVGYYGDYVFNRNLQIDSNTFSANIEKTRLQTNAGYLAANFWDRFDVFSTLGTTTFMLDTNVSAFGPPSLTTAGPDLYLESNSHFSWSLGVRGTLWECGCTSLGMEAQYFFSHPTIDLVAIPSASIYPGSTLDLKYREWQIGAGISHRISFFVPYVAVKWSRAHVNFDNATFTFNGVTGATTLQNLESAKDWGYAIGVSLVDCEKASLTIERRFGDESALAFNGQIRF
jgi:major outer membrane protein